MRQQSVVIKYCYEDNQARFLAVYGPFESGEIATQFTLSHAEEFGVYWHITDFENDALTVPGEGNE